MKKQGEKVVLFSFVLIWGTMGIFFWKKMQASHTTTYSFSFPTQQRQTLDIQQENNPIPPEQEKGERGSVPLLKDTPKEQTPLSQEQETESKEIPPQLHTYREMYARFKDSLPFPKKKYPITGNEHVDAYIRAKAEARGYQLQPQTVIKDLKEKKDAHILAQREVVEHYLLLKKKLEEKGISLWVRSSYRSPQQQQKLFLAKLGEVTEEPLLRGLYDKKIDYVLQTRSIPGYSRHHTGYALDLSCEKNGKLTQSFQETPCYQALAQNDFSLAKEYGFIPSYPKRETLQGPNPEPWEFVWVGKENIQ